MYYFQDFQEDIKNYTCYDFQLFSDKDLIDMYWFKGIMIIVIASFGIIGNLFSIIVLQRLASKSGFNKLLITLGN